MKTKHYPVLFIFFLMFTVSLFAQRPTTVTIAPDTEIEDFKGSAFKVGVYKTKEKKILKELKSELKDKDADVDIKNETLIASEIAYSDAGNDLLKAYAKVEEVNEEEKDLYVIFMNSNKIISSEDIAAYIALEKLLSQMANDLSKESSSQYYEEHYDQLKDLKKDLKKVLKNVSKAEKDIAKKRKSLDSNQDKLSKLNKESEITEDLVEKKEELDKDIENDTEDIRKREYEIAEGKQEIEKLKENIAITEKTVEKAKAAADVYK